MTVALAIGLAEPIGDWRSLINSLIAWTNRDWTDTLATEFIALAEARFNRVLRVPDMEVIATSSLAAGNNELPDDFLATRAVYVSDRELDAMSPAGLIREYGNTPSIPCAYTIIGSLPRKIRLGPQPSSPLDVTLIYYAKIVSVDENNADNWLLNEHPDIYLAGVIAAAELFLVNDERVPLVKAWLDENLMELNEAANRDRYGSGPLKPPSIVRRVRGVRA